MRALVGANREQLRMLADGEPILKLLVLKSEVCRLHG